MEEGAGEAGGDDEEPVPIPAPTVPPLTAERRRSSLGGWQPYRALVLGASGPTGRGVLRAALRPSGRCERVTAVVRRASDPDAIRASLGRGGGTRGGAEEEDEEEAEAIMARKLTFLHVPDLQTLGDHLETLREHDVVFCCLAINDVHEDDFAVYAARTCREADVRYCSLVSAGFANVNARLALFRQYGQREDAFKEIGFRRLAIFRPALLTTDAPRSPERYWEWAFGKYVPNWLFLNRFKAHVNDVGFAMVADHETRHSDSSGSVTILYENDQILAKCHAPIPTIPIPITPTRSEKPDSESAKAGSATAAVVESPSQS